MKVLMGSLYIDSELAKRMNAARGYSATGVVYTDEVPVEFWATEDIVRNTNGAREPGWLKRHLEWRGCQRLMGFGMYFIPCGYESDETGYCRRHKARAVKDGRAV